MHYFSCMGKNVVMSHILESFKSLAADLNTFVCKLKFVIFYFT